MARKRNRAPMQWYTMDFHIHTPASSDFQEQNVSYLDILRRADARGMDIISFTDHNTVAGYRQMQEEIKQLELLEELKRLLPEEKASLSEYRRLTKKILILPGIEFSATFGFHILGIFPPDKPVREIEHLLLDLNVPTDQLDDGSVTVGASADVLTAYRLINQAGGLVIAAHANSSNGVAMRGFRFGGQTKIAYTQDSNLHALEVTDLEGRGRHTTARFFNGTKPEYPRRMHCIQGSDSHRLTADPKRKKNFGVGDRATEVQLREITFEALIELFRSNDFARTRPLRKKAEPDYDFIRLAREEGGNIIQDFHESMTVRGGNLYAVIADVCAFSNTNGGTLYIGLSGEATKPAAGVNNPTQAITQLEKEVTSRISPPLTVTLDTHTSGGKKVVRILVPRGEDPPYAVDDNKIYIRSEAETGLAVRDEIVGLVRRGRTEPASPSPQPLMASVVPDPTVMAKAGAEEDVKEAANPPRTGVEVVSVNKRSGVDYYTVRDLRNGNMVKNVTEKSARRLWHYAITRHAKLPKDLAKAEIEWLGDGGLLRKYKQAKSYRYDLVQRAPDGNRFYFGVTDDGIHGMWRQVVGADDD